MKHNNPNGDIFLFNRIKSGDKIAFNELFERHYSDLCEFSYQIISNKQLAEEIVADVFAGIWIKRNKLEVKTNLKSYLFKSTKNTTISYIRKRKKYMLNLEDLLNFQPEADGNPEKDIIKTENLKSYEDLLLVIPERSRMIFKMHRFDNLKYREISDILNISIKTVEKHMGIALKSLRKIG